MPINKGVAMNVSFLMSVTQSSLRAVFHILTVKGDCIFGKTVGQNNIDTIITPTVILYASICSSVISCLNSKSKTVN